jgi:hypothetical protein
MRLLMLLAVFQAPELGELTHFGNKWAWTGTGEVFVPQLVMYATPPNFYANPGKVDADVRLFLETFGFNGFHVFVSCRWFDIGEPDCRQAKGRDPDLDPRTFEALEMLIRKTYAAGGMVHLWMWGDEERGQTPSARDDWGGLDGPVSRKVEAAIAERLGPLPGWTLGYGFDLDEWVRAGEIHAWRDRLQRELPKFHFLGGRPQGPNNGKNHERYTAWNRGLDYASYEHHQPRYATYVAALEANPDKPVMSEDRFRVLHSTDRKHYNPEQIRRGLYHSTFAGGVANIWGYLIDGGSHELGSAAFPNRGQLRTYFEFVRGRFLESMTRCASASANPSRRSLCLGDESEHFLFYREDAARVELDLRDADANLPVIALDTKKPYAEVELGRYAPGRHQWDAPYASDWALAAGEFHRDTTGATTGAIAVTSRFELSVTPAPDGGVELVWIDDGGGRRPYDVERARAEGVTPGAFELIARAPAGETRFTDRETTAPTTYWYRVRTRSAQGDAVFTEARRVTSAQRTTTMLLSELHPANYDVVPLAVGAEYYVDRRYTVASFPAWIDGALLIRTANDDKLARDESFLNFMTSRTTTLTIGFDRRAKRLPYWLDEWEPVQGRIEVEGDAMRFFSLYRREFPAGRIELGANHAAGADWAHEGSSHYIVLVSE